MTSSGAIADSIPSEKNLRCLLGPAPDLRVLIVGEALQRWMSLAPGAEVRSAVPEEHELVERYDLILFDTRSAEGPHSLSGHFGRLRRLLADGGVLLVFAYNAWSFPSLRRVVKGGAPEIRPFPAHSYWGLRGSLRRAPFRIVREYLCFPCLEEPEEIVDVAGECLELPHYVHPLVSLARRLGGYRYIHDGHIWICTDRESWPRTLIDHLSARLGGALNRRAELYPIRLDLRQRGALVLFLRDEIGGARLVARVVTGETSRIVSRNHRFLGHLHSDDRLPNAVRAVLPTPVAEFRLGDGQVFVETLRPGILAWRADAGATGRRLHSAAIRFLVEWNASTRELKQLSPETLEQLFAEDESRTAHAGIESGLLDHLSGLMDYVKHALQGRAISLVQAHGDFGYGNLLVDSRTGALLGAIDWDTGRMQELPGVDLINMEIQRRRRGERSDFDSAVRGVLEAAMEDADFGHGYFSRGPFRMDPPLVRIVVVVSVIRYIVRALQYPAVYAREEPGFRKAAAHLAQLLVNRAA